MKISIVIPAYNEEKTIKKNIAIVENYCKKKFEKHEIIVVEDCSKDKTVKELSKIKNKNLRVLKNSVNRGKGYSVKKGILAAKHPLVLFTDSDLATPIEELDKFLKYVKDYDIIIASRNMKDSKILVEQPFFRQMMGKLFALLVKIVTLTNFKDTQCGFKFFKTKSAKKIVKKQTIDRFSFDVEMLVISKKLGYKVKEVPVKWINDEDSKVSPVKDSVRMLIDLLKIRIKDLKGKYG